MSKLLSTVIPHRLGTREALQRINAGIPQFQPMFGRAATLEQASWAGNTLAFTVRSLGLRTVGTIVVMDDSAKLEAKLPLLFVPFAGTVERLIKKHGAELLAGSAPEGRQFNRKAGGTDMRRKAKAAAQAAGRDWAQLSKEERRLFRQQVRDQVGTSRAGPK